MAFLFADSFDFYTVSTDMTARYNGFIGAAPAIIPASGTQFQVGQCIGNPGTVLGTTGPYYNWASNETTIYGSFRLKYNSTSSTTNYFYLQFSDEGTVQCTITWNGQGQIILYSGTATLIGTFSSQFSLSEWDSWQFQVVIHPSAGSIIMRKNGSTTASVSLTGVNTRGGTSNTWINQFQFGFSTFSSCPWEADDFFLCSSSGAAPNTWIGDIRAIQQMPTGMIQTQWTPGGTPTTYFNTTSTAGSASMSPAVAHFTAFTPTVSGAASAISAYLNSSSGNAAMALYDASGAGGGPGNLLEQSASIPASANLNTFTLTATVNLTAGTTYWIGWLAPTATFAIYGLGNGNTICSVTASSGFPASAVGFSTTTNAAGFGYVGVAILKSNSYALAEATEDSDASYITASVAGTEDIYTMAALPSGYTIYGITYLVYWRKTDAGARTVGISVSANGSADTTKLSLATLGGSYVYSNVFLPTDPTGATWTSANASAALTGLSIIA